MTPGPERMREPFAAGLVPHGLVLVLALLTVVKAWNYGMSTPAIDFYQFWVGGQAVARGVQDFYTNEGREGIRLMFLDQARNEGSPRQRAAANLRKRLETYSTPFLYTVFYTLASGDYERDYRMYLALSLTCTVLGLVVLCRQLGYPGFLTLATIALVTGVFEPFVSDLRVSNVNQIQLGLLTLFLWLRSGQGLPSREFLGGLVLGGTAAFKPNVAPVVAMLAVSRLASRRLRTLVPEASGIAAGALGAALLSSAFFGSPRAWIDWWSALRTLPDELTSVTLGNYAPTRVLADLTGVDVSGPVVAGLVAMVGGAMWLARRRPELARRNGESLARLEDTLLVGMGCTISLLSAPLVWLHYLLLTLPLVLVGLRPARPNDGAAAAVATRQVVGAVSVLVLSAGTLGQAVALTNLHTLALLSSTGTLALFGLGLWELQRIAPAAAER